MRRIWMPVFALVSLVAAGNVSAAGPASWPTYLYGNKRDNAVQDGGTVSLSAHVAESWSLKLGGPIAGSPMIENGIAYVPSWDGNLYAVDLSTHQTVWKRFLGTQITWLGPGGVSSPPAFAPDIGPNGAVLVGGGGRVQAHDKHLYFYALDATTGAILWQTPVGNAAKDSVFDSPLYLNGHVYIGSAGSNGNSLKSEMPPRRGMVYDLDGKTGAMLHKLSVAGAHGTGGAIWGSLSANATGSKLFVATGDGEDPFTQPLTYAVVGLNPTTLKAVDHWQAPPNVSSGDNDFGTTPTVFKAGGKTLVGAGIKTGIYFALNASHLKKGPVWSKDLGNSDLKSTNQPYDDICSSAYASGSAYPGGQTLFVAAPNAKGGTGTGALFALNPANGHTIWSVSLNGEPQEGAVTVYDNTVIVPIQKNFFNGQEGGEVDVRSVTDGHLIGSFITPGTPFSAPVVVEGTIYFGTDDGTFYAVSISS